MRDPQFMARVQRVQEAASGRWLDILIGAGVPEAMLLRLNRPCPLLLLQEQARRSLVLQGMRLRRRAESSAEVAQRALHGHARLSREGSRTA